MFTGGFQSMSSIRGKSYSRIKWRKSFRSNFKKLHYLVVSDSKPTKRKIDQAKKLDIKIIMEKEWNKILDS